MTQLRTVPSIQGWETTKHYAIETTRSILHDRNLKKKVHRQPSSPPTTGRRYLRLSRWDSSVAKFTLEIDASTSPRHLHRVHCRDIPEPSECSLAKTYASLHECLETEVSGAYARDRSCMWPRLASWIERRDSVYHYS